MLPASRMTAYDFAYCATSPVAPSRCTSGSKKTIPRMPRTADRIQYAPKLVPVARAARVRSPAPRARDRTDAPPAPTVVATAPMSMSSGAATLTDARATGPTQRETKKALVSAYTPYAVSYTHLRAHETDSYLVCRLLLEKKKKNT